MKRRYLPFYIALIALFLASAACEFSASTANIADAWMASDETGETRTTVFAQDAVLYAFADLKNAPDDTTLKAAWIVVSAEGAEPGYVINETEFVSSDAVVHFQLENTDYLWPVGQYKVDIYLNGTLDKTLTFEVK